ncbi:hypothetical protein AJ78_03549 [Emergomyces pasteurianus Ep9510]|uniref:Nuclear membrane fusion protein Kar5 n=1 Tax=Emergomyces pasteurianus Ep9510 TaxID=1447872 RepID=A0A1J9PK45_9EURO|nr:hypothetical protein AJ78_03549 [Emergomyces pasteurianus Ep9510]
MWLQIPEACALLLSSLTLITAADSLRFLSFNKNPNSSSLGTRSDGADLSSLLHGQSSRHSEIFSNAIKLLSSMKSSPSCHRLAATNLILSCQSIGGDDDNQRDNTSDSLDRVKSLFAARLALCELMGAGAAIPEQCAPIFASRPKYRLLKEADVVQTSQLEPCLKSLESRPQWWTSYSNSRQNAAVMCQAARTEIEHEDNLKRYKNLADITSILTDSLNQTLTSTALEASRQKAFLEIVDDVRNKILQDLNDGFLRYRDVAAKVFEEIEGVQSIMSVARSDAVNVKKDIRTTTNSMHELRQVLDEIHLATAMRAAEMAAAEKNNYQESLELVSSVRQSVELLRSQDLGRIVDGFGNIYYSMHTVEEFMKSMEARHDGLDMRIKLFEQAFHRCETMALALQEVQLQQINDQKFFQTDLRISKAILKDVTTSAANLQTLIENSYAVFRKITTFGGALTSAAWWILSMAIVFLLLFYPKVAAGVLLILAYCLGTLDLFRIAGSSSIHTTSPLADAVFIICFSLGVISGVCLLFYFSTKHIIPSMGGHMVRTTTANLP